MVIKRLIKQTRRKLLKDHARLAEQNAALIAIIEAAPHELSCTRQKGFHMKPCDCWKAKALKEAQGDE